MRSEVEALREDQYLEDVFGASARPPHEEWLQRQCGAAKWLFDSSEMRKRLCNAAGVEIKHC